MKIQLLRSIALTATALVLLSCVDKAYDLNNISDKDITIGGTISMPLAKIDIPADDLFSFSSGDDSPQQVTVPATFDNTFSVTSGFDLSEYINNTGEIILKGSITSPIDVASKVTIKIRDKSGQEFILVDNQLINASPATTTLTELLLSKEDVDIISLAQDIQVLFNTLDEQEHRVTLNPKDMFNIQLSILKKGGIKL